MIRTGNRIKNTFKSRGFTLIELLIVISILAVLAMLGLPRFSKYMEDAKIEEIEATGVVIGRAAETLQTTDSTVTGDIDAATMAPYLDGETAPRIDFEYTVNINDGILVEYIGTDVVLPNNTLYNTQ